MAITGSQTDFVTRLKTLLPAGWFPQENSKTGVLTPVLTTLLSALGWSESWVYGLIVYTKLQTRITTGTDVWLDLIAQDYFGATIQRYPGETDTAFSARIRMNLLQPRNTVAAMEEVLEELTGNVPVIFEPANTQDTGGYGGGDALVWSGLAYNDVGGYGSLALPFQAFISIQRLLGKGVIGVMGYYYGSGWAGGGYNAGAIEYVDAEIISTQVPDSAIYQAIANTAPAGTIMWVQIGPGIPGMTTTLTDELGDILHDDQGNVLNAS